MLMHKGIEAVAEWRLRPSGRLLFAGVLACAAGGCLSLAGRTTNYMQASPEMETRITGLETRVSALEQAATTRGASSIEYESGERIISQSNPPHPSYGPDAQARGPADR
jgi:hypothetical protein